MMLYKILLIVLLSLTAHKQVFANGLSWAYSVTSKNAQKQIKKDIITFSVNNNITTMDDEKEIISIDYANSILYRYDKQRDECSSFPFSSNMSLKENNMLKLSNFRLFATNKFQKIAHHNCQLKRILFGADFAKSQMIVSPTSNVFGQIFTESMVSYCVSINIANFSRILAIAKQHNIFFESNQFLRQIDIIGLFEILQGFPVQIIKIANNTKTTLSLMNEPKPINNVVIPKSCQLKHMQSKHKK